MRKVITAVTSPMRRDALVAIVAACGRQRGFKAVSQANGVYEFERDVLPPLDAFTIPAHGLISIDGLGTAATLAAAQRAWEWLSRQRMQLSGGQFALDIRDAGREAKVDDEVDVKVRVFFGAIGYGIELATGTASRAHGNVPYRLSLYSRLMDACGLSESVKFELADGKIAWCAPGLVNVTEMDLEQQAAVRKKGLRSISATSAGLKVLCRDEAEAWLAFSATSSSWDAARFKRGRMGCTVKQAQYANARSAISQPDTAEFGPWRVQFYGSCPVKLDSIGELCKRHSSFLLPICTLKVAKVGTVSADVFYESGKYQLSFRVDGHDAEHLVAFINGLIGRDLVESVE